MTALPLSGVVVVDFSRVLAGPLSTMILGDLGADVIKIEHAERGDDTRDWGVPIAPGDTSYYYSFNRNKRSLRLDLATPDGRAAATRLCATADVVVENFRHGGMERFGLGHGQLKRTNPKLVYCAISGYARGGAEQDRPGYDLVVQGEAGLMAINGEPARPPLKFGVAAVDLFTGMYAAQAVLAALYRTRATGVGCRIDLALYDCGIAIGSYCGLEALLRGEDPPRYGNDHPAIVPYGVFDAKDGPIIVAVGNNRQFADLCSSVLDMPALAEHPDYRTNLARSRNRESLLPLLRDELAWRERKPLLAAMQKAGIPCGEVLGLHEALAGRRTEEARLISYHHHPGGTTVPVMNPPWQFDGERLVARRPPMLGEHDHDFR